MRMTLDQVAELVGGELSGDPAVIIDGAGPVESAAPDQITFIEKKGLLAKLLEQTRAAAVLVPRGAMDSARNLIQVDNPRLAFAKVLGRFHAPAMPPAGIHPTAIIGRDCNLGKNVAVSAGVVIGDHVTIGDGTCLHPHVVIGNRVHIGARTLLYPHVTVLDRCRIGDRVIIHAGTVIGSDGFGFVQDAGRHVKLPQTGIVQIDDDVEIGANNTIDRATFGKTWIKTGVKTDNLVHIAHNVTVGEHSLLIAQVGISGSVSLGHHVILAGQAGIAGHISIGNEVIIGAKAGVGQSVPDKQILSGSMAAMPHSTWLRMNRILPQLPELHKKIRTLEKQLAELETRLQSKER